MSDLSNNILRYIKRFRWNSFFIKYLAIILTIIIVPIIVLLALANYTINLSEKEEAKRAAETHLARCGADTQNLFNSLNPLHASAINMKSVYKYLNEDITTLPIDELREMINELNNTFKTYILANDYIYSIDIYSHSKDSFYTVSTTDEYISDLYDKAREFYNSQNHISVFPTVIKRKTSSFEQNVITVCKEIRYNNQLMGLLLINIDSNKFLEKIKTPYAQNRIILCDTSGNIFLDTQNNTTQSNISSNSLSKSQQLKNLPIDSISGKLGSTYYYRFFKPDGVLLLFPEKSDNDGLSNTLHSKLLMTLITFITLIMSILVAVIITLYFYKKIFLILERFEETEDIESINESNEFNLINSIINQTISDKTFLELELNTRLKLLEKAQFIALQSQINPHFVANTLQIASGVVIADLKRDNNATVILSALADLLRSALKTNEYIVSVATEIEYIKKYYTIQNIRYTGRLELYCDIPPETLNCKMLKLSLQPIVENSIIHGIIPHKGKEKIIIKARLRNDFLVMRVFDNGSGIDSENLKNIRKRLYSSEIIENNHIGLTNVAQRYQLVFGNKFSISIRSSSKGTIVSLKIPLTPQ